MKELIGFKIEKIEVCGDYQENIKFTVSKGWRGPNGVISYDGGADCCSETYFSDVINQSNIIGQTVTNVEEVELVEGDYNARSSRQEEDEVYGIKIYSGEKFCLVTYRNCSNGYYGGWCELGYIKIGEESEFSRLELVDGDNWSAPVL